MNDPRAMAQQLADILERYEEHQREGRSKFKPRLNSAADFANEPLPPRWVSDLDAVERDPVRSSLRASARELGWRAYAGGGTRGMHTLFGHAQERQWAGTARAARKSSTLDKWCMARGEEAAVRLSLLPLHR
jgi:hypothetical protein